MESMRVIVEVVHFFILVFLSVDQCCRRGRGSAVELDWWRRAGTVVVTMVVLIWEPMVGPTNAVNRVILFEQPGTPYQPPMYVSYIRL